MALSELILRSEHGDVRRHALIMYAKSCLDLGMDEEVQRLARDQALP